MGLREEAPLRPKFYVESGWKINKYLRDRKHAQKQTNQQTNRCMMEETHTYPQKQVRQALELQSRQKTSHYVGKTEW